MTRRRIAALGALAVVAAAVVLVLASGGGGGGEASSRHGGRIALHTGDFTWKVAVNGPAATVAAENRRPGTEDWRLPGGVGRGEVEGYVASQSVRPGQVQRVYVHSKGARWIRVDVYRMGWYGGRGGRLVLASRRLAQRAQPPCAHDSRTGLTECRWHPTIRFPIPTALTSGVYVVKMTTDRGAARDAMFVLEAARPRPILAQISTSTYEAYNTWGDDSLYPGGHTVGITGTGQGVEVSYDRPYETVTGAGQFFTRDVATVRFLERDGYDVSYTTNPSVDARPGQVRGHRVLLDIGHSEYWSQPAADSFSHARDAGTNLVFLASNTMAWRVRFAPATASSGESGAPDHRIIGYKEHVASDPDRALPSGLFPRGGAPITGTAWHECVTPRVPAVGRSVNHYYAWRPSAPLTPGWLFRGTGLTAAARVGGIVGYELDRTDANSPPGIQIVGSGTTPCQGNRPPLGVSQTTLYRAASGALVFSSGTMAWQLGLSPAPDASPDAPRQTDPRLIRLTENLFAHLLGR